LFERAGSGGRRQKSRQKKGRILPTAFIPFTLRATAREGHQRAFRTDLERLTSDHRASLSTVGSTDTMACLRGAIAKGDHTENEASLAKYLEDRLLSNGIHLDITVNLEP
jgi:hypothetical protein